MRNQKLLPKSGFRYLTRSIRSLLEAVFGVGEYIYHQPSMRETVWQHGDLWTSSCDLQHPKTSKLLHPVSPPSCVPESFGFHLKRRAVKGACNSHAKCVKGLVPGTALPYEAVKAGDSDDTNETPRCLSSTGDWTPKTLSGKT